MKRPPKLIAHKMLLLRTLCCLLSLTTVSLETEAAGKVLDINGQLPELVEKHPDKSWLVKFYAPWCYHCQQLELTYNNVAERVSSEHGNLVVGRVDCTKSSHVCEKYGVDSYPTIVYIDQNAIVKYKGDRGEASMVAFAERLQGPDVNSVRSCNHLKEATNRHGLVVLSNIANSSDELRREFESLASEHKSNHWFYHHIGTCKDFLHEEGLYLLKRHLNRPIKFVRPLARVAEADGTGGLKQAIVEWMNKESLPVYGQINYNNFERVMNTERIVAIAVLDEYKPARRFSEASQNFHKQFEKLARKYAQYDSRLLFGWSSELELIEYVTMSPVSTPNVILMNANFSYHLLIDKSKGVNTDDNQTRLTGQAHARLLTEANIRRVITAALEGKLHFFGGNNYLYVIMRYIMGNFNKLLTMFRNNSLLMSVVFGFPCLITVFVIYTTCFYGAHQNDSEFSDDDDDDDDDDNNNNNDDEEEDEADGDDSEADENQRLISNGHIKQD